MTPEEREAALAAVDWLTGVAETTSAFGVLRRDVLTRAASIRKALNADAPGEDLTTALAEAKAASAAAWDTYAAAVEHNAPQAERKALRDASGKADEALEALERLAMREEDQS